MKETTVITEVITNAELQSVFDIRRAVFVVEQGISPDVERDEHDDASKHIVARRGGAAIGTARLTLLADGEAILARVAVLAEYRRLGVGRLLVKKIEELGANARVKRITLHPHDHLEQFYASLGYSRYGGEMIVASHRLIEMEKFF